MMVITFVKDVLKNFLFLSGVIYLSAIGFLLISYGYPLYNVLILFPLCSALVLTVLLELIRVYKRNNEKKFLEAIMKVKK